MVTAIDDIQAATAPRIKLSSHGFRIDHPDPQLGEQLMADARGVADRDAMDGILRQLVKASVSGGKPDEVNLAFMISMVKSLRPRDSVEAMLVAQMVSVHVMAMRCAHHLAHANDLAQHDSAARALGRLARTFPAQIEALNSYRSQGTRPGEPAVTVQNVKVEDGKSSAVNLIRHHLKAAVDNEELSIINFACWWFRGEEALALAFFRELYAGLGPSLGATFKKNLPKLGARLLRAGSTVGAAIDLAGGAGAGTLATGAMQWASGLIEDKDSVDKLHAELAKALADQTKRFLIIIDDIDRLAPEEALLIFRLVKSVGRLPNVIYLLVYDRALAEKIVEERYPSEGPHYLEKIIQAGFDVPEPRHGDLLQRLLAQIAELCGSPSDEDALRYMNVFYDVVAPEIRSPRDLNRLMNALSVTWPAVGDDIDDVDSADFLGMETLRILQPSIFRALRANKEAVCGAEGAGSSKPKAEEIDTLFFGPEKRTDLAQRRRSLMRLFPRLESVWSNLSYGHDSAAE
nr:P-loop NTPase fold protein [Bradyrhizobium sp. LTSPM299]